MTNIVKICQDCNGSGYRSDIQGSQQAQCGICKGSGYLVEFSIDLKDIDDKLNDILDKCNDIFEKLNEA